MNTFLASSGRVTNISAKSVATLTIAKAVFHIPTGAPDVSTTKVLP